jgi:hypothetical protein
VDFNPPEQIGRIVNIPAKMAEARYDYGIEKLRESIGRTISETNHYEQIEETVRKLRWSTDEGLDKNILDIMIPIIESQSHLWAGWKYLAGAAAAAISAAVIIILAVIAIEIFQPYWPGKQRSKTNTLCRQRNGAS